RHPHPHTPPRPPGPDRRRARPAERYPVPLSEVADRIVALRAEARARHGWIMDTYLLRIRP
ncbi:hypothetical protein ACWFRN_36120, partial [Streptomyces celluloflavus]